MDDERSRFHCDAVRRTVLSLRARMRTLAVAASHGASEHELARGLRDAWHGALFAFRHPDGVSASPHQSAWRRVAAECFIGACSVARWLDSTRTVQIVPPLCGLLWHVSPPEREAVAPTLWFDLIIPDDIREDAAANWAADVRRLIARAMIPHQIEMVMLGSLRGSPAREAGTPPTVIAVWGCMSLYHEYRRGDAKPRATLETARRIDRSANERPWRSAA